MLKRSPATIGIVLMNVVVFSITAMHQDSLLFQGVGDFMFMLRTGANFNPFTVGGEYWRLITSMFMHWGIIHLAVNMFALYSLGKVLEPSVGSVRFILLYFITGMAGGVSSLIFNLYVVSAGASGAVFGLYGFMILNLVLLNFRNRQVLTSLFFSFIIFVVVNYAIAQNMNVDTPGHLGGFFVGLVLAGLLHFNLFSKVYHWLLACLLVMCSVLVVPKHQLHYYEVFQLVVKAEEHMNAVYNTLLTDQQRGDSLVHVLDEWDTASQAFEHLRYIPEALASDTAVLKKYLHLRRQEVDYRIMGIEKETYVYLDSLEEIAKQLDSIPPLRYVLNYKTSESTVSSQAPSDDDPALEQPSAEWVKVYYDSIWREIPDMVHATYFRIGQRDSLGRWQGEVRDYYMDGSIQMKGKYYNGMHDGVFRYYTKDGKYESLGRYDKEYPTGKWENFHPNGQLKSEVYYGDRTYTKSVWDSAGNVQVANGNGKEINWHHNGVVAEEGYYEDGLKQGNWYGYHASGKPHFQEFYKDNLLVRGVAMSESGERYEYDQLSVLPFPEIGMERYRQYLHDNLLRQGDEQGQVKLTFLVDKDGSVRDFVVMESLCGWCNQEAIRLVKDGPRWRPGLLRGHIKTRSPALVTVYF